MTAIAKLYTIFVVVAGAAVVLSAPLSGQMQHPEQYLSYLLLTLACCPFKVEARSAMAGIPVYFVYILFGVAENSFTETLAVGLLATILHSVIQRADGVGFRTLFNTSNMAVTIMLVYEAYHAKFFEAAHIEPGILLFGAAAVFFLVNTFTAAAVISVSQRRSLLRVWREGYFWSFPYFLVGAAIALMMLGLSRVFGWPSGLLLVPVVYLAFRFYTMYMARMEDGKKHAEEMASLHLRTIEALALAIEAKDHTTHDHLRRVQVYAVEVAKELKLSADELEALRAAALLHDIGKLAIPEHIISKPGKLTREEFEKMKIHPIVGAEILERVRFPYPVTPIVRSHHEKWNGTGYPDGLKGEEIPIGARILAAVDCLDALASDRQYRKAFALEEAMRRVAAEAGTSFDPKVVDVLQRRCPELEKMALASIEDSSRLSTDLKVPRGSEPAAGLEVAKQSTDRNPTDFLASIAAARQEVQTLFEMAQDIGNSLSVNETLSLVAMRIKRIVPYDTLVVYVPQDEVLRPEYVAGDNFRLFSSMQVPFGQGLSGWVAANRKPIFNGDPKLEAGAQPGEPTVTTMRSALSVPLIGLNGLVSVITLYQSEPDAFTTDHLRILLAIAPKAALAIENALKYQRAENSAATDFMTGLPNARSLFLHLDGELARCRRTGSPVIIFVCDLNGFKQVNDVFGHLEGNRLLRVVATKLKESCREYDYVARMGGDEFVLIFPGLTPDQIQQKAARLNAITKDAGREVCRVETLGLSIGHAVYPDDGHDAEHLLSEADRRMYMVKQKEKMRLVEPRGFDFDQLVAR